MIFVNKDEDIRYFNAAIIAKMNDYHIELPSLKDINLYTVDTLEEKTEEIASHLNGTDWLNDTLACSDSSRGCQGCNDDYGFIYDVCQGCYNVNTGCMDCQGTNAVDVCVQCYGSSNTSNEEEEIIQVCIECDGGCYFCNSACHGCNEGCQGAQTCTTCNTGEGCVSGCQSGHVPAKPSCTTGYVICATGFTPGCDYNQATYGCPRCVSSCFGEDTCDAQHITNVCKEAHTAKFTCTSGNRYDEADIDCPYRYAACVTGVFNGSCWSRYLECVIGDLDIDCAMNYKGTSGSAAGTKCYTTYKRSNDGDSCLTSFSRLGESCLTSFSQTDSTSICSSGYSATNSGGNINCQAGYVLNGDGFSCQSGFKSGNTNCQSGFSSSGSVNTCKTGYTSSTFTCASSFGRDGTKMTCLGEFEAGSGTLTCSNGYDSETDTCLSHYKRGTTVCTENHNNTCSGCNSTRNDVCLDCVGGQAAVCSTCVGTTNNANCPDGCVLGQAESCNVCVDGQGGCIDCQGCDEGCNNNVSCYGYAVSSGGFNVCVGQFTDTTCNQSCLGNYDSETMCLSGQNCTTCDVCQGCNSSCYSCNSTCNGGCQSGQCTSGNETCENCYGGCVNGQCGSCHTACQNNEGACMSCHDCNSAVSGCNNCNIDCNSCLSCQTAVCVSGYTVCENQQQCTEGHDD